MDGYFQIGATFALLHFAVVFYQLRVLGRVRPGPRGRLLGVALLVGVIALESVYLLRIEPLGIMRVAEGLRALLSGALVLLLAYRATTLQDPRRRRAALLFATGLGLDLVFLGVLYTARRLLSPILTGSPVETWLAPDPASKVAFGLLALALIPLGVAIALLWLGRSREPSFRTAALALSLAAFTGALSHVAERLDPRMSGPFESVFDGLWTLAFPLIVAYAILRHSMFEVDVKARFVIRQGTVGFVLLGVAFVVAEIVANALNARFGIVAGGLAAGLALLAVEPLQRMGRRLAEAAIPPQPSVNDGAPSATYAEQVEIAFSDGALSPKDRRYLETARARLGLSVTEAHAIEVEVAARLA